MVRGARGQPRVQVRLREGTPHVTGDAMSTSLTAAVRAALAEMTPDFSVISRAPDRPPQPRQFLSGATLSPENAYEFAIPRRLMNGRRAMSCPDVARWLLEDPYATVFLGADGGEGKSTYLHALERELGPSCLVIRARTQRRVDFRLVEQFRTVVESMLDARPPGGLQAVMFMELTGLLPEDVENDLVDALQFRAMGADMPRSIPLVIAGRPGWIGRLTRRVTTGTRVRLAPLDHEESRLLAEKVTRAHQQLIELEKDTVEINRAFPNLSRFARLEPTKRASLLIEGRDSLLAGMLSAVYGNDFMSRLVEEYRHLSPVDRQAYLLVSVATTSTDGIDDSLLRWLSPSADIDGRSQGTPWLLDEDDRHRSRHETIGRALIEDRDAASLGEIRAVCGTLIEAGSLREPARDILGGFLESVHIWNSLVPERRQKTESQLRRAVRESIESDRSGWESFEAAGITTIPARLHWARLLRGILPDDLQPGAANEYILARAEGYISSVLNEQGIDAETTERVLFYRTAIRRAQARVGDATVDNEADLEAMSRFIGRGWARADFYAVLLHIALDVLDEQLEAAGWQHPYAPDTLESVLTAWQYLRVKGEPTSWQQMRYAPVVSRIAHLGLEAKLQLLEAAWLLSRALGSPDVYLANMIDFDRERLENEMQDSESRAASRSSRRDMMLVAAGADGANGESFLRLARLSSGDPSHAAVAMDLISDGLQSQTTMTSQALTRHAFALLSQDDSAKADHLLAAVDNYAKIVQSKESWVSLGGYWKEAVRILGTVWSGDIEPHRSQLRRAGVRYG